MKIPRIGLWFAAGIAAMVGAAGTLTTTSAQAAIGCRVDYQVTNQWPGGFGANVIVNNLGDPINGWTLRYDSKKPSMSTTRSLMTGRPGSGATPDRPSPSCGTAPTPSPAPRSR